MTLSKRDQARIGLRGTRSSSAGHSSTCEHLLECPSRRHLSTQQSSTCKSTSTSAASARIAMNRIAIVIGVVFVSGIRAQPGGMGGGDVVVVDYSVPGLKTAPTRGQVGTARDGELIYGPFEAGFSQDQLTRIGSRLGSTCLDPNYAAPGGIDTMAAEETIEYHCNWTSVDLLDLCGGHAVPYHYHERLTCLWNNSVSTGHSTLAGTMLDNHSLYGFWEADNQLPALDACNGHFGYTPDSPNSIVYHYHVTLSAPFTVGCFGPKLNNGIEEMVTLADCRALYPTCDGSLLNVTTSHGSYMYDTDCPCYDGNGSTVTNVPLSFESAGPATPAPTSSTTPTTSNTRTPARSRPSVLLFMPDDMKFLWPEQPPNPVTGLMDSYDTSLVPNMNRVRTEGAVFMSASVAGPKCAPARFNLLTGRYCSRSSYARTRGAGDRVTVQVPTCKIDSTDAPFTLPSTLSGAGYRTIMSGKYHLLSDDTNWPTDYPSVLSGIQEVGFNTDAGTYASNMAGDLAFTHNIEWMTAHTRGEIARAVHDDVPFFAYFASTMPHGPNVLAALRQGDPLDTPNGTLLQAPTDHGLPPRADIINQAPVGTDQASWAGTIATDYALGSIMEKMQSVGVLDSSLIIVLMDHGVISKDALYEGGTRIAMMARMPGTISAGSVISRPVSNLDIAPTIFELTGLTPLYELDGQSWLADVSGREPTIRRQYIFSEIDSDRAVVHLPTNMKLLSRESSDIVNGHPASADAVQLYNLTADPTEQVNLASAPTFAAELAGLQSILACHELRTQRTNPQSHLLCDTASPTATPLSAVPTTVAPTTSAPTTSVPTTAAPTTAVPTTLVPTTSTPATAAPTTAAPTTPAPTTSAPITLMPTTAAPTTAVPTTASPSPIVEGSSVVHRINCGGPDITDSSGQFWQSDKSFNPGGSTVRPSVYTVVTLPNIPAVNDNALLWESERWSGISRHTVTYNLPVTQPGTYRLKLMFIEVWAKNIGGRVFDLDVQGSVLWSAFDIFEESGFENPLIKETTVTITTESSIVIRLLPIDGTEHGPNIYGISLDKVESPSSTTASSATTTRTSMFEALHRINCGGLSITDVAGNLWAADSQYSPGGATVRPTNYITVVLPDGVADDNPELWETERWAGFGKSELTYDLAVPGPGTYRVILRFLESWHISQGKRVFDIAIQDRVIREDFEILTEAGFQIPFEIEELVTVTTENVVQVKLLPLSYSPEGPAIYGLSLDRVRSFTTVPTTTSPTATASQVVHRINCGGPTITDSDNNVWLGDAQFAPGGRTVRPAVHRAVDLPDVSMVTENPALWSTERWSRFGNSDITYNLPITQPGTYLVKMYFIEMWHTDAATRLFNVEVQNQAIFNQLDLFAEVGFQTPLLKEATVTVNSETAVQIKLVSATSGVEGAAIYGLSLTRL
eukprot:m.134300 g.134300  ORF g.134300 m.134300 type:complete len:1419 (+) comp13861_c0_seq2:60-4316(+)